MQACRTVCVCHMLKACSNTTGQAVVAPAACTCAQLRCCQSSCGGCKHIQAYPMYHPDLLSFILTRYPINASCLQAGLHSSLVVPKTEGLVQDLADGRDPDPRCDRVTRSASSAHILSSTLLMPTSRHGLLLCQVGVAACACESKFSNCQVFCWCFDWQHDGSMSR
jgi:hypothetical protein